MPTVAELYGEKAESVFYWLLRQVRRRELTEDLAQGAWLKALLAERRGQMVELSYVLRAAQTGWYDWLAREQRRAAALALEDLPEPTAPEPLPDETAEIDRLLAEQYSYLTAREAKAVRFRALGYQEQEIAELLRVSFNTIHRRLWRARHRSRKARATSAA